MKRSACLAVLAVLMVTLQHVPALAQNTVNGVIARVTQNGVQLKDGMAYPWADNLTTTLSSGNTGGWADLRADDTVRLTLNAQKRVLTLTVTGRNVGQRSEKSLLDLKPVQGGWDYAENVTINGRVFQRAARMGYNLGTTQVQAVVSNRDGYDLLETTIGLSGDSRRNFPVRFVLLGDGQEIYKSPAMDRDTPAVPISVSVKGYTGITIKAEGDFERGGFSALWADPVLVKQPPTIPNIVSPNMNARLMRNTPFVWEAVDGATGYLLELQAVSLGNAADANSTNRFLSLLLPADTTVYNFNVNQMPKGGWRWRVHSLGDTDILGEMTQWRMFTSQ